MESLLNKGMGFVPVPSKHKHFTKNMTWVEYWFDKDEDDSEMDGKPKIFKEKKSNFPKKRKLPEALTTFFRATESEIMVPGNRNRNVRPNLSPVETEALSELMRLAPEGAGHQHQEVRQGRGYYHPHLPPTKSEPVKNI